MLMHIYLLNSIVRNALDLNVSLLFMTISKAINKCQENFTSLSVVVVFHPLQDF